MTSTKGEEKLANKLWDIFIAAQIRICTISKCYSITDLKQQYPIKIKCKQYI